MRYRKGDLVEYRQPIRSCSRFATRTPYTNEEKKRRYRLKRTIIKGTSKDWYCISGHVDVDGNIISPERSKMRLITRRENLKNWWWYI